MSMDLSKTLVEAVPVQPDAARAAAVATDPSAADHPHDPRPLDWEHAVDAAAARLEENWIKPDTTGYMAASGLADEFAATLCAYGMVGAEVTHMQDRAHTASPEANPPGQRTETID